VASTDLPVLIGGESGAGKESVARDLHRLSRRQAGPYVAVNCAALAESLLEAELFGAVRGAYTGAERDRPGLFRRAAGGTLFLDEVGDMPGPMQAKLLRALEQGRVRPVGGAEEIPVDVRIVAATHHDLASHVARGRFRHDLYYRLAVLRIDVPPLRERLADLPALVADLAPRLLGQTGSRSLRLSAEAWAWLRAQPWPGNVRELHAVLARALLRSGGRREIDVADLEPLDPARAAEARSAPAPLEAQMIVQALEQSAGRLSEAASRIGWTRQKLHRRVRALGLGGLQRGRTSSHSSTFQ
jgi:DNA-binding NtrC family response regulator